MPYFSTTYLNLSKPKHMKLIKIIFTVLILSNLSCKNNSEKSADSSIQSDSKLRRIL